MVDFDAAGLFGGIINEGKRPGDNKDDVRQGLSDRNWILKENATQ